MGWAPSGRQVLTDPKGTVNETLGHGKTSVNKVNTSITGDRDDAGNFGLGQYKGKEVDINDSAFNDTSANKARQDAFAAQLAASQGRERPGVTAAQIGTAAQAQAAQAQGATIDPSQQAQFRAGQTSLAAALQAQAAGQGPSLAQSQLQSATDRNIAQSMALAASQRGVGAGQGLRSIQQNAAMANQQAARQSAEIRAQEQMAAQQQLAGVLQGARQQDIGLATDQAGLTQQANLTNAQLQQQTSLANMDAQNQNMINQAQLVQQARMADQQGALQTMALNDAQARFYNQGMLDIDQQNQAAAMALEQLKVSQQAGLNQVNQVGYQNASEARGGFVKAIGSAAAMMSDENVKEDVEDGKPGLKGFLRAFSSQLKDESGTPKTAEPTSKAEKSGKDSGEGIMAIGKLMGGSGEGGAAAMSDENTKTNTKNGEASLKAFVSQLGTHKYNYKDQKHGEGAHISPMAQEIEKSEIGKSLIVETPEGKAVNYAKAGGVMLATAAMLNKRMEEIDAQLAKALKSRRSA